MAEDGFSLAAHKVIMAVSCDYFKRLFPEIYEVKTEYRISNINGKVLSDVFTFIYTKNIFVTETNIKDLLIASDFLLMKDLYFKVKECVICMIRVSNCINLLEAAYKVNDNEVLDYSLMFMVRHFKHFTLYDFEEFPFEILKRILNSRNLNVKNENTVFNIIVQWIQAYPETRSAHVKSLLSVLAIRQIEENLRTEILNHGIVSKNVPMKSSSFDRSLDILERILIDFKPKDFRIPQTLNLISRYSFMGNVQLFISYDETHDLWRKIVDLPTFIPLKLIASGANAYIFEENPFRRERCWKLNLKTMEWKQVRNLFSKNANSIISIENSLYVSVYENHRYLEEYDVSKNKRFRISSLNNIIDIRHDATAIGKDIFVVAVDQSRNCTQIFSIVTREWTILTSPKGFHEMFKVIAYQDKIYLINLDSCDPKVEVFDPATNVWRKLPDLDYTSYSINANIINDRLIVYDHAWGRSGGEMDSTAMAWNEIKESWEVIKCPCLPQDIR